MNKIARKSLRLDRTTIRSLTSRDLRAAAGAFRIGTGEGTDPKSMKVIACPGQSYPVACVSLGVCPLPTDDCTVVGSLFGC
jgi:hypothetical protein